MRRGLFAGALLVLLLTSGLASARPTPGARWLEGEHEGEVPTPCCSSFALRANASDPDDSGAYDYALANASARSASTRGPVSFEAALAAHARAWDSRERDAFDNATARAMAALNVTLQEPVRQTLVNASARPTIACANGDRAPGPESCALAAARGDPLAAWRAALAGANGRAPGHARGVHYRASGYGGPIDAWGLDASSIRDLVDRSLSERR